MEREYKEIITPVSQQKIQLKAWLTGREKRAINSVLLSDMVFSTTAENEKSDYKLTAKSLESMQDKKIETIIVSINGDTKDILNEVLEMRAEDFDFILDEINKITEDLSDSDKKK